jgi:hypothetical protein
MKHATDEALDRLHGMLAALRELEGLAERKRGVFYRKSRAFLHFHEHREDLYLDVRMAGPDFERHRVTTAAEQRGVVAAIRAYLESVSG